MNKERNTRYCLVSLCLALVVLLWSGALALLADTHYVSLDGANESPYTNGWASAAHEIQWAVNAAGNYDTVLVSNGTYNLTNQISITTLGLTVRSLNGTNVTIINGNYPAYTNRCFSMTYGVLSGFTISNGYASGGSGGGLNLFGYGCVSNCFIYGNYCSNNSSYSGGGGVYCRDAEFAGGVRNCSIISNTVYSGASADHNQAGGGAYMYRGGFLFNSYISGNIAPTGGGVYLHTSYHTTATVFNCTVADNRASRYGGVKVHDGACATNCVISNNYAAIGGGAGIMNASVKNSIIIGNVAGNSGGVYIDQNGTLSKCQVLANMATNGSGGGVYVYGIINRGYVSDCIIANNISQGAGAGMYLYDGALVKNTLIYNNTNLTGYGGGVYAVSWTYCSNNLVNCTIAGNQVGTNGGGIYISDTNNHIYNCIIYSNVSTNDNYDEIYVTHASSTNRFWHTCTPTNLAPNQGNTTNNPLFVDQGNRNYRLDNGSPCINTGTNQGWWTTTSVDLDGRMRIRYGIVDMGAYEHIFPGTIYTVY